MFVDIAILRFLVLLRLGEIMRFIVPARLTTKHQAALRGYLNKNPGRNASAWESVYDAIDILANAQVVSDQRTQTFRQIYVEHVERSFANKYLA